MYFYRRPCKYDHVQFFSHNDEIYYILSYNFKNPVNLLGTMLYL